MNEAERWSKNQFFPTIPWRKEAELQAPGTSSLRPSNASSNAFGVPTSDSDANSVVNDLGDAKQLAQTRDRGHFKSATKATGLLVSYAGTSFQDTKGAQTFGLDSDILSQTEPSEQTAKNSAAGAKTSQALSRKIRAALQTSSWEKEEKRFLPIDKLEHIITKEAIREELQQQGSDVSLVDKIWEAEQSRKSSLTTRRKIFAILVLIGEVPAITDFIDERLYDCDLPFLFQDGAGEREGSYDVYREVKDPPAKTKLIELGFFHNWKDNALHSFDQNQWQLLAPYFQLVSTDNPKVSHYDLPSHIVLPFIEDTILDEPPAQHGGSADVRRVKIHHAHQNLWTSGDADENPSYAVKRLHSPDRKAFEQEVETLKRFSGKNQHHHLINLLLTYHYRGQYHLLFHWADGNLLDYWEKRYPNPDWPARDKSFAKWVCRQWLGVVEALQAIHTYTSDPSLPFHDTQDPSDPRIHGRHGDLKPENILWFKGSHSDRDSPDHLGSFVISDFGLTTFHRKKSKSRVNPENLGRSHTYRPPDYDVLKEVSQKCDIWSLGCVLLEFLHWYLLGWKGVKDFQNSRLADGGSPELALDDYFNIVEDDSFQKKTIFKESVKKSFQDLRNDPGTTSCFLEVLDLVQFRLLRMNPDSRASCGEIVDFFRKLHAKCLENDDYCTQRISKPRRASTDLSELMATPPTPSSRDEMRNHSDMTQMKPRLRDKAQRKVLRSPGHTGNISRAREKTSEARKKRDSETPVITTPIDEGIDTNSEQDVQLSPTKKVRFEAKDSGISMNTNNTESSYFGQLQSGEGIPSKNDDEVMETQHGPSLKHNFAVQPSGIPANNLQQPMVDATILHSSIQIIPNAESPYMRDESAHLRTSPEEYASTAIHPAGPSKIFPPDVSPDDTAQILQDDPSRPLLVRAPGYEETGQGHEHSEHSGMKNWYSQLFCCF